MRSSLAFLLLAFASGPALACDCVRFVEGGPHFDSNVAAVVEPAAVIADGVIVRPTGPLLQPALFRPTKVLKGPVRESYEIGIVSDCGLMLTEAEMGRPVRLILHGGPDAYEAMRCVNFLDAPFDRAVARRLGGCATR